VRVRLDDGGHQFQDQRHPKNDVRRGVEGQCRNNPCMQDSVRERGQSKQKTHQWPGSADVKKGARGSNGRADQDERAEGANQSGRGNEERIARMNMVITAGEVMTEFMREQNGQERNRKRQSR
jgi:hypothetical protein